MEILFDVYEHTRRDLDFEFYREPDDTPIDVSDKNIYIRVSDFEWQQILYEYNTTDDPTLFEIDGECTHKFKFSTPLEMMGNAGEYIVEVEIVSDDFSFDEFFQWQYIVRETLKHSVPASP